MERKAVTIGIRRKTDRAGREFVDFADGYPVFEQMLARGDHVIDFEIHACRAPGLLTGWGIAVDRKGRWTDIELDKTIVEISTLPQSEDVAIKCQRSRNVAHRVGSECDFFDLHGSRTQ